MSDLFSIPVRSRPSRYEAVHTVVDEVKELAKAEWLSYDQALATYVASQKERELESLREHRDYTDEQLATFGRLLQRLLTMLEARDAT